MKYRIVKNGVGEYSIQVKHWWWPFWIFYSNRDDHNRNKIIICETTKEDALTQFRKEELEKWRKKNENKWTPIYPNKSVEYLHKLKEKYD